MITARSEPVFGAVYKLCAVKEENSDEFDPRIKVSETVEKVTNPGLKTVYRIYNADGKAEADLITKRGEPVDMSVPYVFIDPEKPWKKRQFVNCSARKLLRHVVRDGVRVNDPVSTEEIAKYVQHQLSEEIWEEEQRFENPHKHYMDMSVEYYNMKMKMLEDIKES